MSTETNDQSGADNSLWWGLGICAVILLLLFGSGAVFFTTNGCSLPFDLVIGGVCVFASFGASIGLTVLKIIGVGLFFFVLSLIGYGLNRLFKGVGK